MYLQNNKHKNILKNYSNVNKRKKNQFFLKFSKMINKNHKMLFIEKFFAKTNLKSHKLVYTNLCQKTGRYNSIINHGSFKRQIFKNFCQFNFIPRTKKYYK